ncbi:MAG: RluA family pseudouridine synthase [Candidatus Delongbacteria bacterium]|nr:RluA family pseudouridine synthase [Candidatus Delongbacteria bacterium]MBN2836870.1 RluA family pseudouridine synthase [Candidatus Delongbacteria bacterium]
MIFDKHIVPENYDEKIRLSEYLRDVFSSIPSRNGIYKAIKRGEISVNGNPAYTGDWVKPGMEIVYTPDRSEVKALFELKFDIVYEDEYLAIINKPPGIEVNGNKFKTIVNAIPGKINRSGEIDFLKIPQPVHRIDFGTSGLLMIAKTRQSQIILGNMFKDKTIQKTYHALVIGSLQDKGKIDSTIGGKEAISLFESMEIIPSHNKGAITLVKLSPLTGRTHQLRIHLSSIGHPIVGDGNYGIKGMITKGKGMFLASTGMKFIHPVTNQHMDIHIDIPEKFIKYMNREKKRYIYHMENPNV